MAIRDDKLDFWLSKEQNVMFVGRHGVGKTSMVCECFERAGLKKGETYLYFSAATLDPWVDLVGVPKEKSHDHSEAFKIIGDLATIEPELAVTWIKTNWRMEDDEARKVARQVATNREKPVYLDLVRPRQLALGEVVAVFFDEYNRSHKKVRNAVMEMIQFKSINGKVFPNLKAVWAAINPEDEEEYDVEKMDPAQADRFHVTVEIPYKPSKLWFQSRYGDRLANAAISWWDDLPEEQKKLVSPRRLEYALNMYEMRGDPRDVLPVSTNVSKLLQVLNTGPAQERVEELYRAKDTSAARLWMSNENHYNSAIRVITEQDTLMEFFLPLLNKEKLSVLMSNNERACRFICAHGQAVKIFQDVMRDIMGAGQNKKLVKRIRRALTENQALASSFVPAGTNTPAPAHFNKVTHAVPWGDQVTAMQGEPMNSTNNRMKVYQQIVNGIPEHLTADEALATLSLLDNLISRYWQSTLAGSPMSLLVNVVNHCIAQLAARTGLGWMDILNTHGARFRRLLEKLRDAGLAGRLFTPAAAAK